MRDQLRAIVWLRWRLTRNQWRRSRGLGPAIGAALLVGSIAGGLASLSFGVLLGRWAAPRGAAEAFVMLSSVAFFFMWTVGVLMELQRSEVIDVPRLLHLPAALGPVFVVNYVASHFGPSVVLVVPGIVGLALGAASARGPAMLLAAAPALALVLCTTAWTYCFQGWIATWITNPRRRRIVVMSLTLAVVLVGQLPNILVNVVGVRRTAWAEDALRGFSRPGPEVALTLAFSALAALALWRGYRGTLRYYRGEVAGEGRSAAPPPARSRRRLVERRFPGLSEPASAVAAAALRSLLRAPEAAMSFGLSLVFVCILGAMAIRRFHLAVGDPMAGVAIDAALTFAAFGLVPYVCNTFGFDRDGFRSLVLAPVAGRDLLAGKNAAGMALGVAACAPLVVVGVLVLRPPPLVAAGTVLQLVAVLHIALTAGNALSILFPYRVASASLKASGLPPSAWIVVLACQLFFPALFLPAFVPPVVALAWERAGWPLADALDLALSLALAAAARAAYAWTLRPLGDLLDRRKAAVLTRVTADHD